MTALRSLELPPLWLLLAMVASWALAQYAPLIAFDGPIALWLGRLCIGVGLAAMVWTVATFARGRTSVIPRREASTLLTEGPFRYSRNPIYAADVLVLIGWALSLGAASAFLTAPLFIWVIERRFIAGEEAMLLRRFGDEYARYRARVRRWI